MIKKCKPFFILIISLNLHSQISFVKDRNHIELKNWSFQKGKIYNAEKLEETTGVWENVIVPHTYSMDAIEENGYYRGVAWYRTKLMLPESMKNQRIFIRFEAVGQEATFFVNQKKVGKHSGGYGAFNFEITKFVDDDKEIKLAVNVTNEPNFKRIPVTDKLFNLYGGIYRKVHIFSTPKLNITPNHFASSGVFVEQKEVTKKAAKLEVRTHLSNSSNSKNATLICVIKNAEGKIVATKNEKIILSDKEEVIKMNVEIQNPILWDGRNNPYVYAAELILTTAKSRDEVSQNFGIRTYSIDPNKGFTLNNKPYDLHGVAMHQEWKNVGPALTDKNHNTDMDLVEEIGATTLRLSHYQHSDLTYELADKKGILVWSEIPFVHDYSGREFSNAKLQLKELILQNYNHPSIFVWGLWNEVRAWKSPDEACVTLTKELNELAHKLDKSRMTISASDRGMDSNMGNITDLQSWNKYFGWYYGKYAGLGKFLDDSHKSHPNIALGISEYGAGGNIYQQDITKLDKPKGLFFPEQEQTRCHEISWKVLKDRPFVWSSYVWNLFDFSVGDWNRGGIPYTNHKGLITFDRKIKKDAFYFYKANWSKEPVLYIAERRNNIRLEKTVSVKVYTNQSKVTLFLNNKKVGTQKLISDINIITFNPIELQKGKNTLKVVSGKILVDQVIWKH